ncbi:hypothetical protein OG946_10530 [Streptomyces sp. NBC_01808]|uniref:hypothetical protein n=1 Tax=Streptomyces sp. NBC_01808 TaxID=2975947 RepID=UPI002DDAF6F1|nr:hypothetical protein [Streptomyces sp. NBC_01808]WSA37788.1 hypothetical protein OG946_10530 [Streptomyces sp. NBC_01808]
MDVVVALLALFFVLCVAAGVVLTVKATRAVKRGVERTVADTRRTVQETTLRARRAVQPGAAGDIAGLRLSLRNSIDATRRELEHAVQGDPGLRESIGLLDRLHEYARQVDGELRHLEREPDKSRVAERLPELRGRAERIAQSANSLRWAAQDRARHTAEDEDGLDALTTQIDLETGALRHWTPAAGQETAPGAAPSEAPSEASSGEKARPADSAGRSPKQQPALSSGGTSEGQDAFQALLSKIEKMRKPESA